MLENEQEGKWDAISGVTEGALNAYIVSLFTPDDQSSAIELLDSFWALMGSKSVYNNYDFGMIEGYVMHDGIVKGEPLMDIIDEVFGN
jgi:predicted acylesterase/phospholipase RssA